MCCRSVLFSHRPAAAFPLNSLLSSLGHDYLKVLPRTSNLSENRLGRPSTEGLVPPPAQPRGRCFQSPPCASLPAPCSPDRDVQMGPSLNLHSCLTPPLSTLSNTLAAGPENAWSFILQQSRLGRQGDVLCELCCCTLSRTGNYLFLVSHAYLLTPQPLLIPVTVTHDCVLSSRCLQAR